MTTPELLPCPFCQGQAKLISLFGGYGIVCENDCCGCYTTPDAAVKEWNTRAAQFDEKRNEQEHAPLKEESWKIVAQQYETAIIDLQKQLTCRPTKGDLEKENILLKDTLAMFLRAKPMTPEERASINEFYMAIADKKDEVLKESLTTPNEKVSELQSNYNELILSVVRCFPNESRQQTALKYIRQAEDPSLHTVSAMTKATSNAPSTNDVSPPQPS